jgi:Zinc finger, C3HC4 type (RING finger)
MFSFQQTLFNHECRPLRGCGTPDYIKEYFRGIDLFDTYNPPADGNCGVYLGMGWTNKFRFCPDSTPAAFRRRIRVYMEDKGPDFFGVFQNEAQFTSQLRRVWDPSLLPSFYNKASQEKVLDEDHWCTTTILEVMGCMFGARSVVVFCMNHIAKSVLITDLTRRTDNSINPRFFVDVGLERRHLKRVDPSKNEPSHTMYCALIGKHFNLLIPKLNGEGHGPHSPLSQATRASWTSVESGKKTCCICLDKDVNTVLVPCGHAVFCRECGEEDNLRLLDWRCPSCRDNFAMCMDLYY